MSEAQTKSENASRVLSIEFDGPLAILTMNRPDKRNAMSDELLDAIDGFFARPPEGVSAVILTGTGEHYCSGLDLSEHVARDAETTMYHSRSRPSPIQMYGRRHGQHGFDSLRVAGISTEPGGRRAGGLIATSPKARALGPPWPRQTDTTPSSRASRVSAESKAPMARGQCDVPPPMRPSPTVCDDRMDGSFTVYGDRGNALRTVDNHAPTFACELMGEGYNKGEFIDTPPYRLRKLPRRRQINHRTFVVSGKSLHKQTMR